METRAERNWRRKQGLDYPATAKGKCSRCNEEYLRGHRVIEYQSTYPRLIAHMSCIYAPPKAVLPAAKAAGDLNRIKVKG